MPRPTGPHRTPRRVRRPWLVAGPGSDLDRLAQGGARTPGPHGPWPASTNGDASIDSNVSGSVTYDRAQASMVLAQLARRSRGSGRCRGTSGRGRLVEALRVRPMAVGTRTGSVQPASPDTRSSMAMRRLGDLGRDALEVGRRRGGRRGRDRAAGHRPGTRRPGRGSAAAAPRVGRDIASEAITGRANAPPALRWRLVSKADVSQRPPRRRPAGPRSGTAGRARRGDRAPGGAGCWRRRPASASVRAADRPSRTSSTGRASTSRCSRRPGRTARRGCSSSIPSSGDATGARLTVLERDGAWTERGDHARGPRPTELRAAAASRGSSGLAATGSRWSPPRSSTSGRASPRIDVVDGCNGPAIVVRDAVSLDATIEDAGAADIDADGTPDLVLAQTDLASSDSSCRGSTIRAYRDGDLGAGVDVASDALVDSGVIGPFDAIARRRPGRLRHAGVHRRDRCLGVGGPAHVPPHGRHARGDAAAPSSRICRASIAAPVRARHRRRRPRRAPRAARRRAEHHRPERRLVAHRPRDRGCPAARPPRRPPVAGRHDTGPTGRRVAWLQPSTTVVGSIGLDDVQRGPDGALHIGPARARWAPTPPRVAGGSRWRPWRPPAAGRSPGRAVATGGGARTRGADRGPDLRRRGRRAGTDVGRGPARPWHPRRRRRRLLVAVGLDVQDGTRLPITPDPWADGSGGRWRAGPSARFALAEVDEHLAGSPPIARPVVGGPGRTGSRGDHRGRRRDAPVRGRGRTREGEPPSQADLDSVAAVVGDAAIRRDRRARAARRAAGGSASGVDRGEVSVPLAGRALGRRRARGQLVDDRHPVHRRRRRRRRLRRHACVRDDGSAAGRPAGPAAQPGLARRGDAARDDRAGRHGAPGEGDGPSVVADATGAFTIETPLAPWPQQLQVEATDASGNVATLAVSVVGGVDYRTFPWAAISALLVLAAVVLSGVLGTRRRRGGPPRPPVDHDQDGPWPELEELAPGDGLWPDRPGSETG